MTRVSMFFIAFIQLLSVPLGMNAYEAGYVFIMRKEAHAGYTHYRFTTNRRHINGI